MLFILIVVDIIFLQIFTITYDYS